MLMFFASNNPNVTEEINGVLVNQIFESDVVTIYENSNIKTPWHNPNLEPPNAAYFGFSLGGIINDKKVVVLNDLWVGDWVDGLVATPFLNEWMFGRLITGRAPKTVFIDTTYPEKAANPLGAWQTTSGYDNYASAWGYKVVDVSTENTRDALFFKAQQLSLHALLEWQPIPPVYYLGPRNPTIVFVESPVYNEATKTFGLSTSDVFGGMYLPFNNRFAAQAFKPFGQFAINNFGYATVEGYSMLKQTAKDVAYAVGSGAQEALPFLPSLPEVNKPLNSSQLAMFENLALTALGY